MTVTPFSPEQTAKALATTRRMRSIGYAGILGPVLFVIALVALNQITNGAMHVFVNGDPWTHTFWNVLFYVFAGGWAMLVLTVVRRCPRCGSGFFVSKTYRRTTTNTSRVGGVNVFSSRCVNCELPLA